jgi:hypothetical protein
MAAGSTYTPLATQTLGSAAASVTFSSISGAYTDLVLVVNQQATSSNNHGIQFNGDTGFNYSTTLLLGDGSSASSERKTTGGGGAQAFIFTNNGGSTAISTSIIQIMNYSNTTTYKTLLSRWAQANSITAAAVGLWQNTAAITSVTYVASAGNISAGSIFTLYGIAAA